MEKSQNEINAIITLNGLMKTDPRILRVFKQTNMKKLNLNKIMNQLKKADLKSKKDQNFELTPNPMFSKDYFEVLKFGAHVLRYHGLFVNPEQLVNNTEILIDIDHAQKILTFEEIDDL